MDSTTPEATNKKVVDEGKYFLVECEQELRTSGAYAEVIVRQTYSGGTIIDSYETITRRKKVKTK